MKQWTAGEVVSTILIISTIFFAGLLIENSLWWLLAIILGSFLGTMMIIGILYVLGKYYDYSIKLKIERKETDETL